MMRIGVVIAILGLAGSRAASAQHGACRPFDARAEEIHRYILFNATSAHREAVDFRAGAGMPRVDSTQVIREADEGECVRAQTALHGTRYVQELRRPLWVYRVGRWHVVVDPEEDYDDGTPIWVLDDDWVPTYMIGFYNFSGPEPEDGPES